LIKLFTTETAYVKPGGLSKNQWIIHHVTIPHTLLKKALMAKYVYFSKGPTSAFVHFLFG